MTPQKQKKKRDRVECLRIRKSKRGPRRPYQPPRPHGARRERLGRILIELGQSLERADAEGHRLLEGDCWKLLRFRAAGVSEDGLMCREADGSLRSLAEIQACHPDWVRIILPPKEEGVGVESEDPAEAVRDTAEPRDPIVEYPIDQAPGWRVSLVPPSRIDLISPREPIEENSDAS